jgi:hypothetical protein
MIPNAPFGVVPVVPWPGGAQKMSPTGAVPPAAPQPELGRAAVTQADATAKAALGVPGAGRPVPEIPPDPPPVKGLGIPPLNTAVVGDFDEVEAPPAAASPAAASPAASAISDLIEALQDRAPPGFDRKA